MRIVTFTQQTDKQALGILIFFQHKRSRVHPCLYGLEEFKDNNFLVVTEKKCLILANN